MRFRLVHPNCGAGVPTRENLHRFMRAIHASVTEHADSWPFMEPVDPVEARAAIAQPQRATRGVWLTRVLCRVRTRCLTISRL